MVELSPLVSEFAATEEAEAYGRCFRTKVRASLADPRPGVPHDAAMTRVRATIEAARQNRKPE
ncbi:MAG: stability determinant [Proteobacteria bacterium]|nr:stability determinant [Pseudomonadota bacterium]